MPCVVVICPTAHQRNPAKVLRAVESSREIIISARISLRQAGNWTNRVRLQRLTRGAERDNIPSRRCINVGLAVNGEDTTPDWRRPQKRRRLSKSTLFHDQN